MVNSLKEGVETITSDDLEILRQTFHDFLFEVLGMVDVSAESNGSGDKLAGTIDLLIHLRNEARANKDFATSDAIRDQLQEMGIQLKDGKEGTTYSLN